MTTSVENKEGGAETTEGRRIIFECRVGSHLFGLNGPTSDEDFHGVFLPSAQDRLSADGYPDEWSFDVKNSVGARNAAGDVDRKYYSLKRFVELAAEGQSGALEMLLAPPSMVTVSSSEWEKIKEALLPAVLSRGAVLPFVRFAITQTKKATVKGDSLSKIRQLLAWVDSFPEKYLSHTVKAVATTQPSDDPARYTLVFNHFAGAPGVPFEAKDPTPDSLQPLKLEVVTNEHGAMVFGVASRLWDVKSRLKMFRRGLASLESKYGARSETAAKYRVDFKSLSHAYRLIHEAEELLLSGTISLPIKEPMRSALQAVKRGETSSDPAAHLEAMNQAAERLRLDVAPRSSLPEKADLAAAQKVLSAWSPGEILWKKTMPPNIQVKPIVRGSHLAAAGIPPGPKMGRLLAALLEAQKSGHFSDLESGLALLSELLKNEPG